VAKSPDLFYATLFDRGALLRQNHAGREVAPGKFPLASNWQGRYARERFRFGPRGTTVSLRPIPIQLARCFAALPAIAAASFLLAGAAKSNDDARFVDVLVFGYVVFTTVSLFRFEVLRTGGKVVAIAVGLAMAFLFPLAVTARLGALSLPVLILGPSFPFLIAIWIARDGNDTVGILEQTEPSPTLAALLQGKRRRMLSAPRAVKPFVCRDPFEEPLF
jgi:hypothetical protein